MFALCALRAPLWRQSAVSLRRISLSSVRCASPQELLEDVKDRFLFGQPPPFENIAELAKACQTTEDLDVCASVLKEYHSNRRQLRSVMVDRALEPFVRLDALDQAMALVEDKQTYYLFPSPNFYANAMESFLNKGEPQKALATFERLVLDRKFLPSAADYDTAVRALALGGLVRFQDKARAFCRAAELDGVEPTPRMQLYGSLASPKAAPPSASNDVLQSPLGAATLAVHGALTGASPLAAAADSLASLADKGVASTPIVPLRVLKKKFAADEEGLAKAMEKLAAAGLEVPADDMTGEDMAKWEANDHPLPARTPFKGEDEVTGAQQ